MDFTAVKIVIFSPITHADQIREALAEAGAGQLGHYSACSFSSRGVGRFKPLKGSKPFLGQENVMELVEEEKIEVICETGILEKVLAAVKAVHPYEEPAIDIFPLLHF